MVKIAINGKRYEKLPKKNDKNAPKMPKVVKCLKKAAKTFDI